MSNSIKVNLVQTETEVYIEQDNKEILYRLKIKENLSRALELLKSINNITTTDGKPVYDTHLYNSISTWAFHQQNLFYENLQYFAKYEPLVEYLFNKQYEIHCNEPNNRLISILNQSGITVKFKKTSLVNSIKTPILNFALGATARLIGFFSLSTAMVLKPKILMYTPDLFDPSTKSDFRVGKLYAYLFEKYVKFIEIFHTNLGKTFLKNLIMRRRPSIFLEYLPVPLFKKSVINTYNLSSFSPYQLIYVSNMLKILDKRSERSKSRIRVLTFLLKIMGIRRFMALDDVRYVQEIITACKAVGIPTYGFQHGQFTKFHVGWMNYGLPKSRSITFDKLYVWNSYWKNVLLRYSGVYTESNVFISGPIRPPLDIEYRRKSIPKIPSELHVMVSFERAAPREEIKVYLEKFLEMGAHLHLGVRPDIDISEQLRLYNLGHHPNIHIWNHINKELLESVDCIVGCYSTFLNDMMYYDLPVFLLATSSELGHLLWEDHLGFPLQQDFDFEDIQTGLKQFASHKDLVWKKEVAMIETTLDEILQN